jgi:hypothetical protein
VTIAQLLHSFAGDQQTKTILALVAIDLVLGVAAALFSHKFRLTYLANFAHNDLLGKVVPFFVLHSLAVVSGGTDIVVPGFDLNKVSDAVFAAICAAMVGSILSSLKDLDIGINLPDSVAGHALPDASTTQRAR